MSRELQAGLGGASTADIERAVEIARKVHDAKIMGELRANLDKIMERPAARVLTRDKALALLRLLRDGLRPATDVPVGKMDKEQQREARLQRMYERLGADSPRCIECGLADVRCLEAHHIAGRKYDEATVILCRNHHRILSDDQRDHPRLIGSEPTVHERVGHFLKGIADLFALLVAKLHQYGDELIAFAQREAATITVGGEQ
jgi:hypothetical protein